MSDGNKGVIKPFRLHAAPRDAGTADHVKLPAMQRTGYNAAFQTTLPQRPATMQATVVDGMQSPGDIEQRNLLALYFTTLADPDAMSPIAHVFMN